MITIFAVFAYLGGFGAVYRAMRKRGKGAWASFEEALSWPVGLGAALAAFAYDLERGK